MESSTVPGLTRSFTTDALAVRAYARQRDMAADAARFAAETIQTALNRQGSAAVILASAASQLQFLEALTGFDGIDWARVTLFHMDEYLGIHRDHPASFRRFMRERVESQVRARAFHYIEGDALEPLKECDRYAGLLRAQRVDLCVLGIGENGHIAFNDPSVADFHDPLPIKLVKLDLACRQQQVGEGSFPSIEAVPQYAFTLTVPTLCAAERLLCVVPERRKAVAVRDCLSGPVTTACPASFLRTQTHATLFLDADSASLVEGGGAL